MAFKVEPHQVRLALQDFAIKARYHWVFLEVTPGKTNADWAEAEAYLRGLGGVQGTLATDYADDDYKLTYTTITGADVGSLYGYKRYYVLCTTPQGRVWSQEAARLEAFKAKARWSEIRAKGTVERSLAGPNSGSNGNGYTGRKLGKQIDLTGIPPKQWAGDTIWTICFI